MIEQKKLYCNNCPKMLKLNFYQDKNNKIVLIQLNFKKSLHNLLENLLHIRYKVKEASTHEDSSREARRKCDDWTPPMWARRTLYDNNLFLKMNVPAPRGGVNVVSELRDDDQRDHPKKYRGQGHGQQYSHLHRMRKLFHRNEQQL